MARLAYSAVSLADLDDTASPVPITMVDAATSPHRMRLMFPSFAACSWKNGDDTVNHDGQNPANTPEASPTNNMIMVTSSLFHVATSAHLGGTTNTWPGKIRLGLAICPLLAPNIFGH